MKKLKKELAGRKNENKLQNAVIEVLNNNSENDQELINLIEDIQNYGLQSGILGEFIYYKDTTEFYKKYQAEISSLLNEVLQSTGLSISELFGDKWDQSDPLANEVYNQNLLCWFAVEETVYLISGEIDLAV